MAIDDPTALPENAQQTAEYIREADLAFDRAQHDLALSLYWSASSAGLFAGDDSRHHAYLRVGTILVGQGNDDEAYRWLEAAGPAGADLRVEEGLDLSDAHRVRVEEERVRNDIARLEL